MALSRACRAKKSETFIAMAPLDSYVGVVHILIYEDEYSVMLTYGFIGHNINKTNSKL